MGFSIGNILGFGQKKKTQHDYGKKDTSFWGKGVKWVSDHAGAVEDIAEEVAGVYPKIMKTGTMDAGAWSCGMVAGLISDKPTVKQLIDNIMAEANTIINQRLTGL